MRTLQLFFLGALAVCAPFAVAARQVAPAAAGLTPSERALVEGSREAIIKTGLSVPFFEEHFSVERVVDSPGDRRVVWRFKSGEHEARVVDSVGFYTDGRGRRVNTHTVGMTLGRTRDIRRTISRRRAEGLMRACIGEFEPGGVVYQAAGRDARAALVLTAVSLPPPEAPAPPAAAAPAAEQAAPAGKDSVRQGGKKKPFLWTGAVNLETGRCTRGLAQVGSPLPPGIQTPPARGRRRPRR